MKVKEAVTIQKLLQNHFKVALRFFMHPFPQRVFYAPARNTAGIFSIETENSFSPRLVSYQKTLTGHQIGFLLSFFLWQVQKRRSCVSMDTTVETIQF